MLAPSKAHCYIFFYERSVSPLSSVDEVFHQVFIMNLYIKSLKMSRRLWKLDITKPRN